MIRANRFLITQSTKSLSFNYAAIQRCYFTAPTKLSKLKHSLKETASGVVEIFPGKTPIRKLLILSASSFVTSWLVANEWYIVNNETTISVLTLAIFAFLYKTYGRQVVQFVKDAEKKDLDMFLNSFYEFIDSTKETLERNRLLMQSDKIIAEYHRILQENVELSKEIAQLKARARIVKETTEQLESVYKKEQQQIYAARMERALQLRKALMEEIRKPEMVRFILNNMYSNRKSSLIALQH